MSEMSEMSNVPFTSGDIEGLTDRLGRFASKLTPPEWRLLLAIFVSASNNFEAASDTTQGQSSGPPESKGGKVKEPPKGMTPEQLRDQLRKAYIPGKAPPPKKFQVTPPQGQPGPP